MSTPRAPTGIVTFLFTDIEGSTRLWQQHPEAMKRALTRHHALLQQAIESHGGYVFQIVGDAFCAAFQSVSQSVSAALAGQRALTGEPWGETGPIRVRMAVHTGTADVHVGEHKSGEYASGLTLSHSARLLSVAHGGQILVSSAAQEILRDDLPGHFALRDLGQHRLRDLARAEHIFQVIAPDLAGAFPPLASLESAPSNLPRQLTSFVGREDQIAEVTRLLIRTRLLTLTGSGGSGKTRLSLETASRVLSGYPDGVCLVELAPVSDPALVGQALASALSVREEAGRPLLETLIGHLRERHTLLILDNCEHVIDACAHLADALLRACPDVTILASSREPLGLTGEVAFRVPPLSVPDPRQLPPLERFTDYEAIRLFVDRAAAVKPGFALADANASAVVQVCQRLDGIPLAIELAAARVRTLSVQQIASHLDERFRLLTGGSRTALPRHQTLRGLIDWSYGLLAEPERILLRRVAVFVGGFTLDAAMTACADGGVDRHDVVDLLARLVDKSLVLADEHGSEARYRLLETIRQYALERLAETAEGEVLRARHLDVYLRFAEAAERHLQGPDQASWLVRLETDHDNLRSALRWSLDRGETEPALRLGSALWPFWDTQGYVHEAREWLDELLTRGRALPASAMTPVGRRAFAKALDGAALMRARSSEFAQMIEIQTEGLSVWRELGDKRGVAEALNNIGDRSHQRGDRVRGKALVEESLALFQEIGDTRGVAHALNNLGDMANKDGDQARARTLFEASVPLFEAIEDWRGLSHAFENLGGLLTVQGDQDGAETSYQRSLQLAEELGDKHAIATALRGLGTIAYQRGDHVRARVFYEDSVARFRVLNDGLCLAKSLVAYALSWDEVGDREQAVVLGDQALTLLRTTDAKGELALHLDQLGEVALGHGNVERAGRCFDESLGLRVGAQDPQGIATSLEDLARVAAARGQALAALRVLAATAAWRRTLGVPRHDAGRAACDRAIDSARRRLDVSAADAAWSEGTAMTLERAIVYAREHTR